MSRNQFTEISKASVSEIVKKGLLTEVLLALIVNPSNAVDIDAAIVARNESFIEIDAGGGPESRYRAPIYPSDFASNGAKAFEMMKTTVSQWCRATRLDPSFALMSITYWDIRFGVWCASEIARTELENFGTRTIATHAINAVQRFLVGEAQYTTVSEYAEAAWDENAAAGLHGDDWTARVTAAAANIADAAIRGRDVAPEAVRAALSGIAKSHAYEADYGYEAALKRLLKPMSEACLTVPMNI
jgi:hypothetical protein